MSKWYIVNLIAHEKILVEISDDEDENDAKEIALGESRLFRQTEKDFEVQVDIEPAANECLEREMRYAHLVIPRWDGGESRGTQQDRGHGHYECAVREVEALRAEVEKLRADLKESDEIREKLGQLLTRTATALKGEPPEDVWHSWHDLPEKATQLVDALRKLEERVQRDEDLLREALYALEYAHDMTKPEDLQGCGCPICTSITALRERLAETTDDLTRCPNCGGPADNGHDREVPPNPYWCSKCSES